MTTRSDFALTTRSVDAHCFSFLHPPTRRVQSLKPKVMCKVSWCDREIEEGAHWRTVLCSVHAQYKEYAKQATVRPWLMYKVESFLDGDIACECCGYDPRDYYPTRPLKQLAGLMDVDHIDPATKGTPEGEHPDNYQLVCKQCHVLKSYDEGDYTNKRFK